jgi:pullulanase
MHRPISNLLLIFAILVASFSSIVVPIAQAQTSNPETVNIPGTHQDELGCPGEWMPDCENTQLTYDTEDDIWQGVFEIQPANDGDKKGPRYKAALNGSWTENYGINASTGGADIPLLVAAPTQVKFYYDHKTHWIADTFNKKIIVAAGDFQSQLGCANDNDAGCLRSWLEDPEGDGIYALITTALKAGTYSVTLTINEDATQTLGDAQSFTVANDGDEIYFGYDDVKKETVISTTGAPKGSLSKLKAVWVNQDTVMWSVVGSPKYSYSIFYSPDATLQLTADGVQNGTEIPLTFSKSGPGGDVFERNPYLNGYSAFKIDVKDFVKIPKAIKGQVTAIARDDTGKVVDVTGVQLWGVLDALYTYDGKLGIMWDGDIPTLSVWAPTAQSVSLNLFNAVDAENAQKLPMQWDSATGVWSITGKADWKNKFYLYEVSVYVPSTGKIETNQVTDPYSLSLSMNSKRSQIVDLNGDYLKPPGWDTLSKPALAAPEDIVIYELHIRDFSINDQTVPEEVRGTYVAFTEKDSNGMKHLRALAEAGLTHIHLLPAFDIASVNEDRSTWQTVDESQLKSYSPDSDEQAKAVSAITGSDGFNWGYDPLHYTVPEGSYSTAPDGGGWRTVEFRAMVQALNESGLRVVMDVVYNHTNASGQNENSVLDRIVPGYYHRLNAEGKVEKSTCCENTATEHAMMHKLMVDSVVTWAKDYKVDGFRFDLMGHHMLEDMKAVRAALDALTLEKDGVDGKSIYVYGEGWNFGEVAYNARGKNATQLNIAGTGIGVFNDRLRDAVRGGNPFDDIRLQGFATGLLFQNNANESRSVEAQQSELNEYTDWIRIGLAGNLSEYLLTRANGETVTGAQISYNGAPAGYTSDPQENIVYVSAHDNQTIFDTIQVKASADATLHDRIRMNNLALSVVMFSQGIPFFHAGDDILRSKSFDPNSYNSGDWYNKLDWTYESNNFGVGLPLEGTGQWNLYKPLLAQPELVPTKTDIESSAAIFREFLQIRKSSRLFRLETAEQVKSMVSFYNNGPEAIPGLIVMDLKNVNGIDASYDEIVVLFNAQPEPVTFTDAAFAAKDFALHSVQQSSVDATVRESKYDAAGSFTVPGRTTAIFSIARTQPVEPTAPGNQPSPASDDSNNGIWTMAGIIAILIAIQGAIFFIKRRRLNS